MRPDEGGRKMFMARCSQRRSPMLACMSLCLAALAIGLLLSGTMQAQVLYGSLTGNVTDPSGALIPGAKVMAANSGTGVTTEVITNERGSYLFSNLLPGLYKVTVSAAGFTTVAI